MLRTLCEWNYNSASVSGSLSPLLSSSVGEISMRSSCSSNRAFLPPFRTATILPKPCCCQHFWREVRNLRGVPRLLLARYGSATSVLQDGRVRQSCVCTGLGKFPDDKLLSGMCEALTETSSMAKRLMQVLYRHRVAVVS